MPEVSIKERRVAQMAETEGATESQPAQQYGIGRSQVNLPKHFRLHYECVVHMATAEC